MSLEMFSRSVVDRTIVHIHNWRPVMRHWHLHTIVCVSFYCRQIVGRTVRAGEWHVKRALQY